MRGDDQSFEQFWTAFLREHRPFRLGRAGLSLVRMALDPRGRERWRWAVAAAVLTAGKLLAGTLDDELEALAPQAWADDARALEKGAPAAAAPARGADTAWAVWM